MPLRNKVGYRSYTVEQAAAVRAFIAAGRPFEEIDCGSWIPKTRSPDLGGTVSTFNFPRIHQRSVPPTLIQSLLSKNMGQVAEHLASLPRLRPTERQAVIACVRDANDEMGFIFNRLLLTFLGVVA